MIKLYRSAPSRRLLASTLGVAALSGFSFFGCSANDPTEIVAGVSTQIRVPDDLRSVGVVVQVGGRVQFCQTYNVIEGLVNLPATLGVLDERIDRGPVTVQVLGLRTLSSAFDNDCVAVKPESLGKELMVIRRRRLSFVNDRIVYLPLPLKDSCRDNLECEDDETCIGGKCVSADIDATTLPDYSDSLVFGNTNTCFDGNSCMPKGRTVPVVLEDRDTCTFQAQWPASLPRPEKGGLNVRLFYDSFGSEILDLDAPSVKSDQREGFAFEDEDEPLRFRLAPNLCESNYQVDKVLAVDASALCPAKRALQPLCDGYIAPDPRVKSSSPEPGEGGGNGNGTNSEPTGTCTIAGLRPVESVVYVLMDRSDSMFEFFGMGGLEFAIGLPLASPVAKRTKIGFDFLPPDAEQCGTNEYATPLVPFGNVEAVRSPIAQILGGADVLPNDPPQFFLEAALLGAYQGVSGVQAAGERFNRRAVVVLSNRDILNGACPGTDAVTLAQNARAEEDPVFTYAVALKDGEDGALASAEALANAGGTTVFNGVDDEAEGALAVQEILTELGTCLYEVQRSDAGGRVLPTTASISYINPLSPSNRGVDIEHNAACEEDAPANVSGWNQGADGLVRLCGGACEDLREIIGDVGTAHLAQQHVAPAVPLVVTASCDDFELEQ